MKPLRVTLIAACVVAALFAVLCLTAGCTGHAESFGAGVVTGSAVTHTLEGAQKDLEIRQVKLLEDRAAILDQLENANSDAEKVALQAKVEALEKQLELTAAGQAGTAVAGQALATDWTDPEQAAPWLLALLTAGWGVATGKQKKSVSGTLQAVLEGVEKYKAQASPEEAEKLYLAIRERKSLNNAK